MAVTEGGSSGALLEVDPVTLAARVSQRPPNIGGAFKVCALSGLITGIAAGTASAGHLFAARWGHASKLCMVTYIKATWVTVAGFTAAQEVGMDLTLTRSYTVSHSGGTAITLTGNNMKKRVDLGGTNFTDIRVSTTSALANGTHVVDSSPIAWGAFSELAAGAAVPKGFFSLVYDSKDAYDHPLILKTNEGIILRNTILMGAGGTARVGVEFSWLELDTW